MSRDLEKYVNEYVGDYGFERVLVLYRRRLVLERIRALRPARVLEIGCGSELLYAHYLAADAPVDKWVIVEPAREFAKSATEAGLPNAVVIENGIEDAGDQVSRVLDGPPELIICSGLLHEVTNADAILASIARIMGPMTKLHANVPNALSMHRRLAVAMGLISEPTELSDRNRTLLQHRVYTIDTLQGDLERAGLRVVENGGILIKPFTHAQMERIAPALGEAVLDGLDALGRLHPEWASEIYAEAVRSST